NQKAFQLPLSFQPSNVATGDIDGDGLEEVVAVSSTGNIAICKAVERTCDEATMPEHPLDVAVGDLNGDGFGEIVFLNEVNQRRELDVWNRGGPSRGQKEMWGIVPGANQGNPFAWMVGLSVADIDGDGFAEA